MTTDTIGGVWTYTMDLIKGLEKYNVEIVLATFGDPLSHTQLAQVRKLKKVNLDTSGYKLEWMPDPWKDIERAQRWLLQLSFTYAPDVIHLNSYAFNGTFFNAPVIVVGHSCVLSWWQAVKHESAPADWNRYRELVKQGLHTADVVVAPSHTMMMKLIEFYGEFNRSQVIYNSVDESYFKPGKKEKIVLYGPFMG
ncbi:MAG: glycosyltransferase [Bacteroidales bacterium]|nr:glycosyltransferase [Bacteroidales bacterium]